jgi:hypothetical protein
VRPRVASALNNAATAALIAAAAAGKDLVVLGAGGAEPGPQVLHLPGGDHHHGQARSQHGIDEHAVAPLDRDLAALFLRSRAISAAIPALSCAAETRSFTRCRAGHAHNVVSGGPVDPGAHAVGGDIRQNLS